MFVNFNILNQLGSPAINSNTFANRPAAGQIGRLFVSTDTFEIYRDNGTTWDLIGGPGSSTITGTGTATQVAYFTSSQSIGSSSNLFWDATNNRLGLGTQTPGARLDIHSAADVGLQLNGTGASPSILQEFLSAGVAEYDLGYVWNADVNYQRFRINDVSGAKEVLTIDKQSRFVGINYQYSSLSDQPAYTFDVSGSGRFTDSAFFATDNVSSVGINTTIASGKLHIVSETDGINNVTITRYGGATYGPHVVAQAFRGTKSSPTAIQLNDRLYGLTANGYNGTTNIIGGLYRFFAAENFTGSAAGTNFQINLASIGTTTETQKLLLTANGILGVNVTPSNWVNTSNAVQIGTLSSVANLGGIDTNLLNNAYYNGTNFIYIVSQEASRYLMNRNTHKWYNAPAGTLGNPITFTQIVSIESSGNTLFGTSTETANGGVVQISNGVTFPATQVPVSNSNTLDDYEEGQFTPVITGSTTAGTATYSDQNGRYTKIGNVVYFRLDCIWTGHTGTGQLTITGFPFNVAQQYMCVGVARFNQAITALYYLGGHYIFNATFYLEQMPVGGGGPISVPITANGDIRISGFYIV